MKRENKLIKDTLLYAMAHFGSQALVFIMLPIYTLYFSPVEFGTWDIALSIATLAVPFITFELTSATYRWLIDDARAFTPATIISTGFFQILMHTIIFNLLASFTLPFLPFSFKWEVLAFVNVMIWTSFIQQCTRGLGLNLLFAMQGLIQTALGVVINIYLIIGLGLGIAAFFYAQIIGGIIVIIFACVRMNFFQYIGPNFISKLLRKEYFVYAIPIIPATASWWLMTMADRWIIAGFLGLAQNGIYAIAIKIPAVLLMVNTVFSLAWKDSAITNYLSTDKDDYYTAVFQTYFRFMATVVICLILASKWIVLTFIDPAYAEAWKYSGILLVSTFLHAISLFWAAGFHGAKQTKSLLITTVIGAVLNIALNLLLIQHLGLYAIAIALLLAYLTTWLMRIRLAKGYFEIRLPWRDIVVFGAGILLALPLPFYLGDWGLLLSFLLACGVFVWGNWRVGRGLVLAVFAKRA